MLRGTAVKFKNAAAPGLPVQQVDILGVNRVEPSGLLKPGQNTVDGGGMEVRPAVNELFAQPLEQLRFGEEAVERQDLLHRFSVPTVRDKRRFCRESRGCRRGSIFRRR